MAKAGEYYAKARCRSIELVENPAVCGFSKIVVVRQKSLKAEETGVGAVFGDSNSNGRTAAGTIADIGRSLLIHIDPCVGGAAVETDAEESAFVGLECLPSRTGVACEVESFSGHAGVPSSGNVAEVCRKGWITRFRISIKIGFCTDRLPKSFGWRNNPNIHSLRRVRYW